MTIYTDDGMRIWSRLRQEGDCLVWTGALTSTGYGSLTVRGRRWKAHRFAYTLRHGPIPAGIDVCHTCDNPPCCNPAHLFVGTRGENLRDMVAKGRHGSTVHREKRPRREAHPMAKLSPQQAAEARCSTGYASAVDLARRFGVHPATIYSIRQGRTWR